MKALKLVKTVTYNLVPHLQPSSLERRMRNKLGLISIFAALILGSGTISLEALAAGGSCSTGCGGNSYRGKMMSEYAHHISPEAGQRKIESAEDLEKIIKEVNARVPAFGEELLSTAKSLTIYLLPGLENKLLSEEITGLKLDTDQEALHNSTAEVLQNAERYAAKDPVGKLSFLMQEALEELISKKHPEIDPKILHANARKLAGLLISSEGKLDEKKLQEYLIGFNIGYYPTTSQNISRKLAEQSSPIKVSAGSNVVVLKNNLPINMANPQFMVGDTIRIETKVSDPNGLPVSFRYVDCPYLQAGNCEDRPSTGPILEYTFKPEDARTREHWLLIYFSNKDNALGLDDSAYTEFRFLVNDGIERALPVFNSMNVFVNDIPVVDTDQMPIIKVGDTLRVETKVKDPNGLPVTFTYVDCPSREAGGVCIGHIPTGPVFEHTFTPEEARVPRHQLTIYFSNRESPLGMNGSNYKDIQFHLEDGINRELPVFESMNVFINNTPVDADKMPTLKVGDTIRVETQVKDPKGLPVHFSYVDCPIRNAGGTCVTHTSTNSVFEYTFKPEDARLRKHFITIYFSNREHPLGRDDSARKDLLYSIDDGVERALPMLDQISSYQQKLKRISKAEARDLALYLRSQDPHSCSVILRNLNDFLNDGDRSNMEVLALFANKIDDATKLCLTVLEGGLPGILKTPATGKQASGMGQITDPQNPEELQIAN